MKSFVTNKDADINQLSKGIILLGVLNKNRQCRYVVTCQSVFFIAHL